MKSMLALKLADHLVSLFYAMQHIIKVKRPGGLTKCDHLYFLYPKCKYKLCWCDDTRNLVINGDSLGSAGSISSLNCEMSRFK